MNKKYEPANSKQHDLL